MNANGLHKIANLLMCTAMAKNYIQNMTTEALRQVSNRERGVHDASEDSQSTTGSKTVQGREVARSS